MRSEYYTELANFGHAIGRVADGLGTLATKSAAVKSITELFLSVAQLLEALGRSAPALATTAHHFSVFSAIIAPYTLIQEVGKMLKGEWKTAQGGWETALVSASGVVNIIGSVADLLQLLHMGQLLHLATRVGGVTPFIPLSLACGVVSSGLDVVQDGRDIWRALQGGKKAEEKKKKWQNVSSNFQEYQQSRLTTLSVAKTEAKTDQKKVEEIEKKIEKYKKLDSSDGSWPASIQPSIKRVKWEGRAEQCRIKRNKAVVDMMADGVGMLLCAIALAAVAAACFGIALNPYIAISFSLAAFSIGVAKHLLVVFYFDPRIQSAAV